MTLQNLLRLDNASFIYPASQSKKYSSLYRMSVTLSEPVAVDVLQQALEATVARIPTFHYTLTGGALWWYPRHLDATQITHFSLIKFVYGAKIPLQKQPGKDVKRLRKDHKSVKICRALRDF